MRGSGKSTVAKLLADKLNRSLVETDWLIAQQVGMSIADFVRINGWDAFRKIEHEVVTEVAAQDNLVISPGGGVLLDENNSKALKKNGTLIFLYAPLTILLQRIGTDKARPSLTGDQDMAKDLEETWKIREPLYKKAADTTIDTENKSTSEVANQIIKSLDF